MGFDRGEIRVKATNISVMDRKVGMSILGCRVMSGRKARLVYNISRGAAVQSAYSKYRKILSLLYPGLLLLLHSTGSGITFIIFATFILFREQMRFLLLLGRGDRDFLY